jgi:hypothetical protein
MLVCKNQVDCKQLMKKKTDTTSNDPASLTYSDKKTYVDQPQTNKIEGTNWKFPQSYANKTNYL